MSTSIVSAYFMNWGSQEKILHQSPGELAERGNAVRLLRWSFALPCAFLIGAMGAMVYTQRGTLVQLQGSVDDSRRLVDEAAARRLLGIVSQWGAPSPNTPALEELRVTITMKQITRLLVHDAVRVRQSAVRALAEIGDRESVEPLLSRLADREPAVRILADRAIRAVWSRLGSPEANDLLNAARQAMAQGRRRDALRTVEAAIRAGPDYAEAYNQRAILHFQSGDYALSAIDCERALVLMPYHYGAMAGLGQCFLRLGDEVAAVMAFYLAQRFNPNLALEEVIMALRWRIVKRPAAV